MTMTGLVPDPITVGFTGSSRLVTRASVETVRDLMTRLVRHFGPLRGIHGDCVGWDGMFDRICGEVGCIDTVCRPCTFDNMRARTGAREIAEPVPPMQRNRAIVADATVMIACPPTREEQKRGGTWATIRFTRRAKKPLAIVYPEGDVDFERWDSMEAAVPQKESE